MPSSKPCSAPEAAGNSWSTAGANVHGRAGGPGMLHTSGSAHSPHKAGVRRQLRALQPELRFLCCCKNKVLRGEKINWHKKEQSLFPTLTEGMEEIQKGWGLKKENKIKIYIPRSPHVSK